MKFLLFNVAVAAALAFLFTADRGEVQKIAGRVHDAAGDMKAYAGKALDAGQTILKRDERAPARKTEDAPVAPQPKPVAPPPVAKPVERTVQPPAAAEPKPAAPKPPVRQLAQKAAPVPAPAPPVTSSPVPAGLDPAVAKRRRELLDGLDTAGDTATGVPTRGPALKDGTRLMTASERRRELLSLAEEMELLYARSISR